MFSSALKKVVVGIALIGATGFANAATYDLGVLNTTVALDEIQISGSFDDVFHFTAGNFSGAFGGLVGMDLMGDLEAHYRFGVGTNTVLWDSWSTPLAELVASDPDTGSFSFSQSATNLVAGQTYWFNVAGYGTAASYSVTMAPVPEPGTLALLLSGLGLVGAVGRRKNSNRATGV